MAFAPCIVIPVYNHGYALPATVDLLKLYDVPIFIVDDGSDEETKQAIRKAGTAYPGLRILTHRENRGKGAALKTGFRAALEAGFTHGLQVDADGQHDLRDVPAFLAKGREHPECLICGAPMFDDSIPKSRLYGRRITNFWIAIETLSLKMPDAMCGYRLYPLQQTVSLLNRHYIGNRMEFEIEMLVRFAWLPLPIHWVRTNVRYPEGGRSTFRLFFDNVRISWAHTRLLMQWAAHVPALVKKNVGPGYARD